MSVQVDVKIEGFKQTFSINVVGVTHKNSDGSDRQSILAKCKIGEPIKIVREPDNPFDKSAVALFRKNGEQIGYLPKGDRLSDHIDKGGMVKAKILKITGGPGFWGLFFKSKRKNYGCVLEMLKGDYNWDKITPYLDKCREIDSIIKEAKDFEKSNPKESIALYKKSVNEIKKLERRGKLAKAWRNVRYPINRLTMVLEHQKRYEECTKVIEEYLQIDDRLGLTKSDYGGIKKRKDRVIKRRYK